MRLIEIHTDKFAFLRYACACEIERRVLPMNLCEAGGSHDDD